jgi:hypothetical protein
MATRGHASGTPRPGGAGLAGLGATIADLGWSGILAFTTSGMRGALSSPWLERVLGWAAVVALGVLTVRAWLRPASGYSRPFALGLAVYLIGMVALATTRGFDSLSNGRTFIPALPLVFVLAVEQVRSRAKIAFCAGLLCISLPGIALAARGVSRQIAPDFQPALPILHASLTPSDSIGINLNAVGLSAWVDQRVIRIDDSFAPWTNHRCLVLAADLGKGRKAVPAWSVTDRKVLDRLTSGAEFELAFQNPGLSVWRRRHPSRLP